MEVLAVEYVHEEYIQEESVTELTSAWVEAVEIELKNRDEAEQELILKSSLGVLAMACATSGLLPLVEGKAPEVRKAPEVVEGLREACDEIRWESPAEEGDRFPAPDSSEAARAYEIGDAVLEGKASPRAMARELANVEFRKPFSGIGDRFAKRFLKKFKKVICGKGGPYEQLQTGLLGQAALPTTIVATILGTASGQIFVPILVYGALLLAKTGLATYCEGDEEPTGS